MLWRRRSWQRRLNRSGLSARYLFRIEDLSKLQGMEESLRVDLRGAVADAMDAQVIAGNGTAPNVNGLTNALTAPADPSNVFTWVDAVRAVASQVDGKFCLNSGAGSNIGPPWALFGAGRLAPCYGLSLGGC